MPLSRPIVAAFTFALVGMGCIGGAIWAVDEIEARSEAAVRHALLVGGEEWASVRADGLQLILTGTADDEATRFRALSVAGRAVDSGRLIDAMQVAETAPIEPPRFSVELLRNDDGISLVGLIPAPGNGPRLADLIAGHAPDAAITDMMETTALPAPPGWDKAVAFGLIALDRLPRSKISIAADRVAITAIGNSAAEKRRLEAELARLAPQGVALDIHISAPRPVITPFTLRFIIDATGARFDACSADNERGRARILAAGRAAGARGKPTCTLGLGVPSPQWADAASLAIAALAELGAGSVTFSDADVSLIAADTVPQALFDRVVGDLEARLPKVFSLQSVLQEKPENPKAGDEGPPEFTATLSPEGQVQLRGRLPNDLVRQATDSFARAKFGADAVYTAARLDPDLPDGWPVRALAGLAALAELHHGSLLMRADLVEVRGTTGNPDASDTISRILSDRLGSGQVFKINVAYDERFDPFANLPTPQGCVESVNDILTKNKVNFDPGSANIEAAAGTTLNKIADVLRTCPDVKMEIGGHTDSQGRREMNQQLSQRRAEAVLGALLDRRVPIGNLTARGYGPDQPIADNGTEAGREANRRIEVRLILPEGVDPAEDAGEVAAEAPTEATTEAPAQEATQAPAAEPAPQPAQTGETEADAETRGETGGNADAPDAAATAAPPQAPDAMVKAPGPDDPRPRPRPTGR
jgi:OOP family OmpA-OmpF porin